jgi:uncharacterized protein YndB with AHSA1/START domain
MTMTWDVSNTRLFPATQNQLFEAVSDPARLAQWWGPNGFTNTFSAFDFRPGGLWHLTMHAPDGTAYPNESEFVEIVPSKRIVLIHHRPMHRYQLTMKLQEEEGGTRLSWLMAFDQDEGEEMRGYITKANEENFDRLAAYLTGSAEPVNEIRLSWVFPVARESVFRAWTEPYLLADWWGRHDFTNPVCKMDARVGGEFHIVMRSPDSIDYPLRGSVREIESSCRLTLTLDLSQYPQAWRDFVGCGLSVADTALVNEHELALHFTDSGPNNNTRIDLHIRFPSPVLRDAFLRYGILEGWNEGLDSLHALLTVSPVQDPALLTLDSENLKLTS